MKSKNLLYSEFNVEEKNYRLEVTNKLTKLNKQFVTVPQIFANEQYIGGYTQLKEWHDNRTQGNSMIDEGGPIN